MGGSKPPESGEPVSAGQPVSAPSPAAEMGRGIGTLLRGVAPDESPAEIVSAEPVDDTVTEPVTLHGVPRWSFFAGDILLVGFAAVVAFNTAAPLDLPRVLFCAIAVGVGAWLGIQPFMSAYRTRQRQARATDLPAWLAAEYRSPDGQAAMLLIHAHPPLFFAKVRVDESGKPSVAPVTVPGTPEPSTEETSRLLREALDFHARFKKT